MSDEEKDLDDYTDSSKVEFSLVSYDKSQALVDIANNTFKELCRTLENERTKLIELEERRKKLQEEMQRLKMEIEEEKQSYRLNLGEPVSDNLEVFNACKTSSRFNLIDGGGETEEESVHEFIDLQRFEIQRLTTKNLQLLLNDESSHMDEEQNQDMEQQMADALCETIRKCSNCSQTAPNSNTRPYQTSYISAFL